MLEKEQKQNEQILFGDLYLRFRNTSLPKRNILIFNYLEINLR